MVEDDYRLNGRRSLKRAVQSFAHLRRHFGFDQRLTLRRIG
jgi:hypothetical protein